MRARGCGKHFSLARVPGAVPRDESRTPALPAAGPWQHAARLDWTFHPRFRPPLRLPLPSRPPQRRLGLPADRRQPPRPAALLLCSRAAPRPRRSRPRRDMCTGGGCASSFAQVRYATSGEVRGDRGLARRDDRVLPVPGRELHDRCARLCRRLHWCSCRRHR